VAIDQAALLRLSDLAGEVVARLDISVPRMAYSLGLSAPTIELPQVAQAPPVTAPRAPIVSTEQPLRPHTTAEPALASIEVAVPAMQFSLPTTPPVIEQPRSALGSTLAQAAPTEPREITITKPAVAGYEQRALPAPASPEPRPVAPSSALAKPSRLEPPAKLDARAKPEPAKSAQSLKPAALIKSTPKPAAEAPPGKSGKFLRWEGQAPVYDD
jgi:hypothetical protein